MYQLVNAVTCDIIHPASPNLVFGFFMGRSQMSLYLGHLDIKVIEVNTVYQLVNVITCEIADTALPISVFGFFMDFNETLHNDSLTGSNMCPTNLNGHIMHQALVCIFLTFVN